MLFTSGRRRNVDGLELEKAEIIYTGKGLNVDAHLCLTNNFFTISDVIGGLQFPHVAGYHASVVVKNVLFRLPAKADNRSVPWVTYTSSELVQVVLNKGDARKKYGDIDFGTLLYAGHDWADVDLAKNSMKLMAEKVMPKINQNIKIAAE